MDEKERDQIAADYKREVIAAMKQAEGEKKPHLDHTFTDVYDKAPRRLEEQRAELHAHLAKYGEHYHLDHYSDTL